MNAFSNLIGGEWIGAQSGRTVQTRNPADTREVVAEYPLSGQTEAAAAIAPPRTTPFRRGPQRW